MTFTSRLKVDAKMYVCVCVCVCARARAGCTCVYMWSNHMSPAVTADMCRLRGKYSCLNNVSCHGVALCSVASISATHKINNDNNNEQFARLI